LVGAGLAAATWLIGGSLEKFADGLGKLEPLMVKI
jgi:hypothetical protein